MTSLDRPDLRLRPSWADAVEEFAVAGEEVMHGSGLWDFEHVDTSEAGARLVVEHLLRQADPAVEPPEGRVRCTYFWITDGGPDDREFVGYLALRHALTAWLLEEGGHIGYAVRPSARRQGVATEALRLMLPVAAARRIDPALVTCDEDNVGSRLVIEKNGGRLEDLRNGKLRFWVPTGSSAS